MKPVVSAAGPSKRTNRLSMSNLVKRMNLRRAKANLAWMPRGPQFRPHREPMAVPLARPALFLRAFMFALLALALGGVVLWSAPAQAQTATALIKNTGQTAEAAALPLTSSNPWRAQAFTTGSNSAGYTLSSIGFYFASITDTMTAGDQLEVTISSDSSDEPGAELCTLTDPATFSGSGVHTFDAPSTDPCPTLAVSTKYFAVIKRVDFSGSPTPTISLHITAESNEDDGGATGWSIEDTLRFYTGSTWFSSSSGSYLVVVRGEADNNPATGAPSITGAAREGVALAAGVADISDTDGLTGVSYAYQWEREDGGAWGAITGATAQHYYVSAADVGKTIRVVVRFTDDADNAESASSAATDAVTDAATINVVWSATLTVAKDGDKYLYSDGTDATANGGLSPATFSLEGNTYTVHELNNNAGGDISLLLSDELPTAFTLLHAPSGTRASSATDAAGADGTGYRYTWYENDTLWSDGDQVAVAVQVAVNNPPAFDDGAMPTRTLPENSGAGVDVVGGVITATDSDSGDTLTYSLASSGDHGSFEIDSNGQISTKTGVTHNFNFEASKNSYSVTVNVRDSKDAAGNDDTATDDTIAVTIDLTNVNDAPEITTSATTANVAENTTAVFTLAASDEDASETQTWSVESGDDGGKFNISSTGALTFKNPPNFEMPTDADTMNDYDVTVKVADAGGLSDTHTVSVTVTNVNEAPEITTTETTVRKDENETHVILVQASDVDASDTLNWSVESADDGGKFKINTEMGTFTTLSFKNAPNFEMPTDVGDTAMNNAYVVTLKITDAGGLSGRHTFTVEVNDVNEAPEINGAPRPSFAEIEYDATSPDLTIGTYTYEDEDRNPADTITWGIRSLSSLSADAEHFNISGSGVLSFNMRPDFENPFGADNAYLVEVQADDGQGGVGTFPVTVNVTNVDETPKITTTEASHTAPSFVEIEYDATMENLVVAEYEARDEEEQIIAWSRTGADAGDFSIDSMTGVLSFAQRPDFEMPADDDGDNVYNITVRARDTASNTRELEVVVTVTDVNERPDINEDTVPSYVEIEYDFTGTLPDVHTFTATDYDDMDTFEWSLVGTDAAYLDIGAASGILTFTQNACANDGPLPDFEEPCDDDGDGSNTYSIIVVATDDDATDQKFSEYAVVVAVTDVNEAPEFTGTPETALTPDEHDANTDYVVMDLADYDARDEEGVVTWSLTGTDRGDFAISADGVVTFAETPNYEEPKDSGGDNGYEFTVVATDVQSGSSRRNVSQAVTVTVGDVEEAGTVTVDNLSPAVSQTLTFRLIDPDGGIDLTVDQNLGSPINWRLESLASGESWTQVVGLSFEVSTTFRYTVDEDVTGKALRAVVTYVDRRGSGKTAVSEETAAVTSDPIANAPPRFRGGSIWNVEEGPADRAIGPRITATDRDNDALTYGIQSGQDAASFEINPSTGQVRLVEALDFEPTSDPLNFTVTVHDGRDSDGNPEDPPVVDDTRTISFFVLDVEEDGVVTLSTQEAETGTPLTATLEDGDGGVTGEVWQWARSRNGRTGWTNISEATSSSYTPTVADEDFFLRATVAYTDRRGAGKSAAGITGRVPSENRRPTFPSTEDGQRAVRENTRAGQNVGAPVAAVDPENNSLTYSLSGSDSAAFTVVRSTGQLRTSEALDFETKSSYDFTVEVHDGRDGMGNASTVVDDTQAVTITVENEEEPGVVTLATDTGTIQARAEVTATLEDDDGVTGSVGWQWARSPNGRTDWVNIAGAVSAAYTPTLEEDRGNYIRATATYDDDEGSNKTANAVSRRVGDPPPVNSAPVFPSTENGRREVAENSTDGTAVGDPVAATDLNAGDSSVNDPLVYSLTGTDAASFAIDAGTGQIRLAADVTLDYEGKRTYRVTVEVTDGRDQHGDDDMDAVDDRQNVTITVTDVNEAPVVTGDDEPSYEEGSNRAIATYTAADPERDTLTWSVTNDTEFWISQRGQLYFRTPPSYEVQMSYSVTVTATDDDATTPLAGTLDVAVTVTDAEEEGMVTIEPPRGWDGTIFEAVLDDDDGVVSGETWQWARSSNRSRWADILGATSSSYTATSADENQYLQLTVSYTDRRDINKTASAALTGRIGDSTDRPTVNTLPEFTEDDDDDIDNIPTTTRRVASGAAAGRNVGAPVRATDEDTGEVLTYSLGGTDALLFDIDAATGQIRTKDVLDSTVNDTYEVTVSVHDGFNDGYTESDAPDATIVVTITVTAVRRSTSPGGGGSGGPVNRAPVFQDADGSAITETARAIAEDVAVGTNIGEPVAATDPDDDPLTYTVSGDDAASFAIDASTGQLTTATTLSHETRASYSVTVTATDPSGATAEIEVAITVTEVVVFDCTSGNAVADASGNPGLVADCEALLKSRDMLSGDASLNWSEDTAITEWDGVRLGGTPQRVTRLYLARRGLTGAMPADLGSLPALTGLYLHRNELTGSIPPQLGQLSSLVHLTLHRNRLVGEMPAALGDLTALTFLSLYGNNLTGELPAELGGLISLRWLYLHSNKSADGGGLSGAIPAALGDLPNLEQLLLYGNGFSGAIPAELGGLSNLKSLLLHDNGLSGQIPGELGDLSSLRYLWLDDNELTGSIPSELGDLSGLRWLSLYGNDLSGAIPAELGDLSALRLLILDRNDLSGTIPARLGELSELTWLDLNDNDLSGTIPSSLGDLSNLEHLYLHDNDLTGAVPADLGRLSELTNLWLRDNRLSGRIPASLGELPNLQRVRIAGNDFTGCVPEGLLGGSSWYSDAGDLGLPACVP